MSFDDACGAKESAGCSEKRLCGAEASAEGMTAARKSLPSALLRGSCRRERGVSLCRFFSGPKGSAEVL